MNILVTGANGQLGNELRKLAPSSKDHFIFTDVSEMPGLETVYLDITNIDAVRLVAASEKVDVIVNCAAYTNVDKAEDDIIFANLLNSEAPGNLAKVCAERGATLFHISTDYIFNASKAVPLREYDEPDPQSVYGSTKLAGEKAVRDSRCKSIIIRTAWLFSPFGKNFVRTMLALTETRESVKVVYDQVGTPTYAADLAKVIIHIISSGQMDKTGVYHYSNEGAISWYDFACAINEMSNHRCKVEPCLSSEFPSKVRRPSYSVLDKSSIRNTFGIKIPYWKQSLADCLKRLI